MSIGPLLIAWASDLRKPVSLLTALFGEELGCASHQIAPMVLPTLESLRRNAAHLPGIAPAIDAAEI